MAEAVSNRFSEFVHDTANAPWKLWVDPFRIAPNIYYVGNEWVGIFLVSYEGGLIIIDTAVHENLYLTLEAIRKLGFDPYQIKHIMLTHCHCDHAYGARALHELTGAPIWLSHEDAEFRTSPANTEMGLEFRLIPYEVDQYYDNSTVMEFGSVKIQTFLTPGHTPGTTSFLITSPSENGKPITAGLHGGVGPMTMSDSYLNKYGLSKDLRHQFLETTESLKQFHVDIAIPSHPSHGNNFFAKRGDDPMDYSKFIDPEEWNKFLDIRMKFVRDLG